MSSGTNAELSLAAASINVEQVSPRQASIWQSNLERLRAKQDELRAKREEKRLARLAKRGDRQETSNDTKVSLRFDDESRNSIFSGKNPLFRAKRVKDRSEVEGPYGELIARYAREHGVPLKLARAVVQVESNFRANATGAVGEIGLMQIRLSTARGMGYKGSKRALYDPATNLYWGMKYLGRAHQLSGGTTCGTILKYNAGHGAKRMNKVSSRYCGKVKGILA